MGFWKFMISLSLSCSSELNQPALALVAPRVLAPSKAIKPAATLPTCLLFTSFVDTGSLEDDVAKIRCYVDAACRDKPLTNATPVLARRHSARAAQIRDSCICIALLSNGDTSWVLLPVQAQRAERAGS